MNVIYWKSWKLMCRMSNKCFLYLISYKKNLSDALSCSGQLKRRTRFPKSAFVTNDLFFQLCPHFVVLNPVPFIVAAQQNGKAESGPGNGFQWPKANYHQNGRLCFMRTPTDLVLFQYLYSSLSLCLWNKLYFEA